MLGQHLVATTNQKILRFLVKFSGKEFYERQIARTLDIGYGSANKALNDLYSTGVIQRRHEGKMYFYSIDSSDPKIIEFKRLVNLLLIEPLVEKLKKVSNRIILFGSCAQGTDSPESDIDLFVVSNRRDKVLNTISNFKSSPGFEDIHIQAIVKTPVELIEMRESEQAFIEEVEQGIVLWERVASEPRI